MEVRIPDSDSEIRGWMIPVAAVGVAKDSSEKTSPVGVEARVARI